MCSLRATSTPFPTASGEIATRTAFSRFAGPSAEISLADRIEPVTTTGRVSFTVRCRKNEVSSSVSVPCVMTMPRRSRSSRNSVLIRFARVSQWAGVICDEPTRVTSSTVMAAWSSSCGTAATSVLPSCIDAPTRLAMVPPVVRMVTRGFVAVCADNVSVSASTPSAVHRTRRPVDRLVTRTRSARSPASSRAGCPGWPRGSPARDAHTWNRERRR